MEERDCFALPPRPLGLRELVERRLDAVIGVLQNKDAGLGVKANGFISFPRLQELEQLLGRSENSDNDGAVRVGMRSKTMIHWRSFGCSREIDLTQHKSDNLVMLLSHHCEKFTGISLVVVLVNVSNLISSRKLDLLLQYDAIVRVAMLWTVCGLVESTHSTRQQRYVLKENTSVPQGFVKSFEI